MVEIVWEFPIAVTSLIFYRVNRFVLRSLYQQQLNKRPERAARWRAVNLAMLSERGALPCLMTTGPRWNTHALIAAAGPVNVQSTMEIDGSAAEASAGEWTAVVHTFPQHHLVGSVGLGGASSGLKLASGRYIIFLRYYHVRESARFPSILADGHQVISECAAPSDNATMYDRLRDYGHFYYLALHWYVFCALKYRRWLSESWVRAEFLPAGNPETQFDFGVVWKGQPIKVSCDLDCLRTSFVYITLYNRSSFPTFWQEVTSQETTIEVPATGYFLTRRHLRAGAKTEQGRLRIETDFGVAGA